MLDLAQDEEMNEPGAHPCEHDTQTILNNPWTSKAKKLKRKTKLAQAVRAPAGITGSSVAQIAENVCSQKIGALTTKDFENEVDSRNRVDCRNVLCPIPGGRNLGGRGFRRHGISKHLMGQHAADLLKDSPNYK